MRYYYYQEKRKRQAYAFCFNNLFLMDFNFNLCNNIFEYFSFFRFTNFLRDLKYYFYYRYTYKYIIFAISYILEFLSLAVSNFFISVVRKFAFVRSLFTLLEVFKGSFGILYNFCVYIFYLFFVKSYTIIRVNKFALIKSRHSLSHVPTGILFSHFHGKKFVRLNPRVPGVIFFDESKHGWHPTGIGYPKNPLLYKITYFKGNSIPQNFIFLKFYFNLIFNFFRRNLSSFNFGELSFNVRYGISRYFSTFCNLLNLPLSKFFFRRVKRHARRKLFSRLLIKRLFLIKPKRLFRPINCEKKVFKVKKRRFFK